MEYSGLMNKFKNNRALNQGERDHQLKQKDKACAETNEGFTLIESNSTFIEVVDKYYAWKGFAFAFVLIAICLVIYFVVSLLFLAFNQWPSLVLEHKENSAIAAYGAVCLMALPLIVFCIYAISKEAFTYTHWPVRLNRKNRKVYVFRHDGQGGVLTWDDIFFTLGYCNSNLGNAVRDIRGLVIDKDNMVRDTFTMGLFGNPERITTVWEYYRTFMEEGPQTLPTLEAMLPIAGRKEGVVFGIKRQFLNFAGAGTAVVLLSLPLSIAGSIGRTICMLTNRAPKWPQEVLDACQIEANDRFEYHAAKDGSPLRSAAVVL
jgi:hypothetical protein